MNKNKIEKYQANGYSTIKITDNTLYMAKRFPMWGGVQSMYKITYTLFLFPIYFALFLIIPNTGESFTVFLIVMAFPTFIYLGGIFLWRMDLPLCFNRKTQMVTTYQEGQLCQIKWHRKLMYNYKFGPNAYGQYIYVHAIDIFRKDKSVLGELSKDIRICIEREYSMLIKDYMDGKEIVLDRKSQFHVDKYNFQLSIKELFISRFITPFKNRHPLEWFFAITFLELPLAIFILFPADIILYTLNKILPRRRISKELREACGCEEGEKIYG